MHTRRDTHMHPCTEGLPARMCECMLACARACVRACVRMAGTAGSSSSTSFLGGTQSYTIFNHPPHFVIDVDINIIHASVSFLLFLISRNITGSVLMVCIDVAWPPSKIHSYLRSTYLYTNVPKYIRTYVRTYVPTYARTHVRTYVHTFLRQHTVSRLPVSLLG